jgi:hypothetical protein
MVYQQAANIRWMAQTDLTDFPVTEAYSSLELTNINCMYTTRKQVHKFWVPGRLDD